MTSIKGYKVFRPDFTSKEGNFKYAENSEFKHEGEIKICNSGFHFCLKASDCFNYYCFDSNNIVCEVEALGKVEYHEQDTKVVTDHIKVGRRLTWAEVLFVANEGKDNTGHSNSGDRNSGNWNSGNWNSGDSNSGDRNSGDSNSGDSNSGNSNSGNWNSGYSNSGDSNSGDSNSGNWNSGNRNSGNWNSGNRNSGDSNSGDSNSGNWNSGDSNSGNWNSGYSNSGNSNSGYSNSGNWNSGYSNSGNWNSGNSNSGYSNSGNSNSGDSNSGNWNSGYSNSGNWNSGNWNSGDSNSGYRNSGAFCLNNDPIMWLFDKPCKKMTVRQWEQSKAYSIMANHLDFTEWVPWSHMTKEEKELYPKNEVCEGYLKTIPLKEAWGKMWHNLSDENKKAFTELENFNPETFESITGIKV